MHINARLKAISVYVIKYLVICIKFENDIRCVEVFFKNF